MSSALFVRPIADRFLGGVCAAIATRYGWNLSNVRIAALLMILFTGVGAVAYLVLWIAIPSEW